MFCSHFISFPKKKRLVVYCEHQLKLISRKCAHISGANMTAAEKGSSPLNLTHFLMFIDDRRRNNDMRESHYVVTNTHKKGSDK